MPKSAAAEPSPAGRSALLGVSRAIEGIRAQIEAIADAKSTVLLTGESGVGKEVVARDIRRRSGRSRASWVVVNCAAIPENLLESELFGHRRGAFTDARETRIGLFQKAHGGTLFLDEIGELPLALQSKLLRVLDSGEVRPVGETEGMNLDVRVIAATNRDLPSGIAAGTFREDLYYRLRVVAIEIPPLRKRPEDIPILAQHFLERIASRLEARTRRLSDGALGMLTTQIWKGNARELENAIEQAVTLHREAEVLTEKEFPLYLE
ncbi:MAG: sigma 54-interacting transcriptional regulator, partial [Vicinamibacteria bacterium]